MSGQNQTKADKEIRVLYNKETFIKKIRTDDVWLERAVYAIWKNQTADEKVQETVNHFNNKGFTSADGKFLTSLGNWIDRRTYHGTQTKTFGWVLSPKQKAVARRRMEKYAGQLVKIAQGKLQEIGG